MSNLADQLRRATMHAQPCDACGAMIAHGQDRTYIHMTTRSRRDVICLRCWAGLCMAAEASLQDRLYWQLPLEWAEPEPIRRRPPDRT